MFLNLFVPGHLVRRIFSTLSLSTCVTSAFILALVASAPQVKPTVSLIAACILSGLISGVYLLVLRLIDDNFIGAISTKSAMNSESDAEVRKVA